MAEHFDCLIIGAGLSGLLQAVILAQENMKICLLEAHNVPGGYLQTFRRCGHHFNVGFHYLGRMTPDTAFGKYLQYLKIFRDLKWIHYPENCFYRIVSRDYSFDIPTRFSCFIDKLLQRFPQESTGIKLLEREIMAMTTNLAWYDLPSPDGYLPKKFPHYSLQNWLDRNIDHPRLKNILSAFTINLGLHADETPFWKYCISTHAIFDIPVWLEKGGDDIIRPLCRQAQELGVDMRMAAPVKQIIVQNKKITKVIDDRGREYKANWFIAAIHPKQLANIMDLSFKPAFHKRLLSMKDSRGSFLLHMILREKLSIPEINYLCFSQSKLYPFFHFRYFDRLLPGQSKSGLGVCCFIDAAPFIQYRGSRIGKRPKGYYTLKQKYQQNLLQDLHSILPDLSQKIQKIYSSSPLTNEDYTGNVNGAAFGISHDIDQDGLRRISTRGPAKNLLLSGHSIHLPGIHGVTSNAFFTAARILGENYLLEKVFGK